MKYYQNTKSAIAPQTVLRQDASGKFELCLSPGNWIISYRGPSDFEGLQVLTEAEAEQTINSEEYVGL